MSLNILAYSVRHMGTEGQKSWHIVDIIVVVNYQGILVEGSTSQFFYAKGFSNKKPFYIF